MGITGLTLGLGKSFGMKSVALLVETFAGPMHIGLRESKVLVKILEKRYSFGISLSLVEKDIRKFENELKPIARQQEMQEQKEHQQDTSYIG
jgi:proteasome assembly chaperone (PAC2) family protein